ANSSFGPRVADESLPASALVASPLHIEPVGAVTLPLDILRVRRNTAGTDVSCEPMARALLAAYPTTVVPTPALTPVAQVDAIVQDLAKGQKAWNATPVETRAAALEQAAEVLERDLAQWCALIVREGHRTWGDAVSEVREAADFCRYYALQARALMAPQVLPGVTSERNTYSLGGRGVWVC